MWTLTTWCELRNDFRDFRLDRMDEVAILERTFTPKKGQRLEDHLRKVVPSAEERRELLCTFGRRLTACMDSRYCCFPRWPRITFELLISMVVVVLSQQAGPG